MPLPNSGLSRFKLSFRKLLSLQNNIFKLAQKTPVYPLQAFYC